jgi:hypothetical protein
MKSANTSTVGQNLVNPSDSFMKIPPTVKSSAASMIIAANTSASHCAGAGRIRRARTCNTKSIAASLSRQHYVVARLNRLARQRDEVDVCRTKGRANHFDGDLGLEILAGENIDVGIAGPIAKMPGRGLD